MTSPVRRAGGFAAVCTLSLAVPLVGPIPAAAIAAAVLVGTFAVTDGPLFDLFALPSDHEDGRLYGLIAFVLAAVVLGALATTSSLPVPVFVGAVVLVGYGNLTERLAGTRTDDPGLLVAAFCAGAAGAAAAGQLASRALLEFPVADAVPAVAVLAVGGALLAALLRDVLFQYDDPIVVLSVGLFLWLLAELEPTATLETVGVAVVGVAVLGYLAYALRAVSATGMTSGVLLAFLTIVLGGWGWFLVLFSFFAIGGLSTKFRYERKANRGVAEENGGARGTGNVLGNAAVALVAVLGYAASSGDVLPGDPDLFLFAFAGSLATALSDTLSSEIGVLFESPRLITTLEPVEPGTDGAVTWQGWVAGTVGALVVAGISYGWFVEVEPVGAAVVVVAGVVGMLVDSVLGATLEGAVLGNQGVNFLATLSGAVVGALVALSWALVG